MKRDILELEPESLWCHFNAICAIPHPSGHEGKLAECIVEFCAEKGVACRRDAAGNLHLHKEAAPGLESAPVITLQCHLDMVPQCDSHIEHNFETDPIKPVVDGEWMRAENTTLGADNGIGVAAILALMESSGQYGPLSAILTVEEETGLTGANNIDPAFIDGDTLINLDSEDFEEIYIACAGGCETNFTISPKFESLSTDDWESFELSISGLEGGHSGVDIHLGRGNANIILAQLLVSLMEKQSLRLISFNGGSLSNAIPREGCAVFAVKRDESMNLAADMHRLEEETAALYQTDPKLQIKIANSAPSVSAVSTEKSADILSAVAGCPNGALAMSSSLKGIVETSSSLGVVKTDAGKISITTMQRSLVEANMVALKNKIVTFMENIGFESSFGDSFPPWKPAGGDSKILKICLNSYRELFGVEPRIVAIHAGLECGVIGRLKSGIDMVSFGPTIKFPHSPKEKVNIDSVLKFWNLLTQILALPKRSNGTAKQDNTERFRPTKERRREVIDQSANS